MLSVKEKVKTQENKNLITIYVGDARNIVTRILRNHCRGNVEGSALRKHIAEAMGYRIIRTRRPSGSVRVRIGMPNPRIGEGRVSAYIQTGRWKYAICESYNEAHDFQWYVIEMLNPLLNKERKQWKIDKKHRYTILFQKLSSSPLLYCKQLYGQATGPGVYVFYHNMLPNQFNNRTAYYA